MENSAFTLNHFVEFFDLETKHFVSNKVVLIWPYLWERQKKLNRPYVDGAIFNSMEPT